MIDPRAPVAAHFNASELRMSYQRTTLDLNVNIQIQQPKWYQPSDEALTIMGYVANSDRMTGQEKASVIRLLAMADAHTTGRTHDKLMKTIAALIGLMEFNARAREAQPKHSLEEVLGYYQQQRRLLDPDGGMETVTAISINVHVEVEQFSLQYTGLSIDAALQAWDAVQSGDAPTPAIQLPVRADGCGQRGAPVTVDTTV
ncbi:MAG: hypothetical protein GC134_02390 [Proteobacteria bacterium]|nr:hypothetical protein [Pseudomonadota bacterium]